MHFKVLTRSFFTFFLFFLSGIVYAQQNNFANIDRALLASTRNDKWYSDVRNELKKVQFYDLKKTLEYIDKILDRKSVV